MTDDIKLPPLPVSANFYGMYGEYTKSQVEALMREAVRLNATVPDAPTWEQVQKAWYAVGADVAGLDWSAFVRKVSAALNQETPPMTTNTTPSGADALRAALEALVRDIECLIDETQGVYGLHLNGDPSPWCELLPGGRYERLSALDDARATLAAQAHEAAPQSAAQPLTDEQINTGRQALPYDIEDKPEPWSFKEGVRFAERMHGIGVKND